MRPYAVICAEQAPATKHFPLLLLLRLLLFLAHFACGQLLDAGCAVSLFVCAVSLFLCFLVLVQQADQQAASKQYAGGCAEGMRSYAVNCVE